MIETLKKYNIDFRSITSMAYIDLMSQSTISTFPILPNNYKNKHIRIISFQKYCDIANIPLDSIICDGTFSDGFSVQQLRPGLKLLLYNDNLYIPRQNFTFMHEIGHLALGHTNQGGKEETEANFFAGQFLAPNCIIQELRNRNQIITERFLIDYFGLSKEAARKKMDYLKRFPDIHKNEYDSYIIEKFKPFLNEKFPKKNKYFTNEYWEDLQLERNKWIL